jgi:hypothetical protein
MATALPILDIQEPGADLARKTVFIKLHLGLLGNSRKVRSSQVEVDADKELIRVAKTLLDSFELQAIRTLDGDVRRFLYDTCLPFEVGIHLLPLAARGRSGCFGGGQKCVVYGRGKRKGLLQVLAMPC